MTNLNQIDIHDLLKNPTHVDLDYQRSLVDAYHDEIDVLHTYFTRSSEIVRPAFPITLYYYSDNGGTFEDTASKEIKRFLNDSANIVSFLSGIEKPHIEYGNTPAQNWNASGFELAQTTRYGLNGVGNVTFLNCAPRLDERGQEDNKTNRGEPVYVGILPNGHVVAANSRYNLVHFRDAVKNDGIEFYEANVQIEGTQFRSRDIFPLFAVVLTNQLTQNIDSWKPDSALITRRSFLQDIGLVDIKKAPLSADDIPQLEGFTVSHIDVHGNIKLNVRGSDVHQQTWHWLCTAGGKHKVSIGNKVLEAEIKKKDQLFDSKTGEAALYQGSSGIDWQCTSEGDGFLEIAIVGDSVVEQTGLTLEELKEIKKVHFIHDWGEGVKTETGQYYNESSHFKPSNQVIYGAGYGLG